MKAEGACPYCHKLISPNSAFCVNCGRDLRFYGKPTGSIEETQPEPKRKSIVINCTYCQKSSPEGSNYCVHCGKELRPDVIKETLKSSPSKKISSIFNILVFLAAIASIVGFIYFYVENKINTPADKNPKHEEIVGNLYRNTKYQFRIKFPEEWEIKNGDGPNILIKATSGEGTSISIYVKDLGIELGDITDLISLDEWANSINENFPSAKIISKKEIYIDNRKAYFVQYSMNYKALDREIDGICYNVSLINKNYSYAITASSQESKFESNKHILDASVRTFVIEEYGTNVNSEDQESTFQSDKSSVKKEKKFNKPNSSKELEENSNMISITLGPDTIRIYEQWSITITVRNEGLKDWSNFPEIKGLKKKGTNTKTSFGVINGQIASSQSVSMTYLATKTGSLVIYPFQIKINEAVISSPGKSILVLQPNNK